MVSSALLEVCGKVVFSFTRSVAEHFNPNEAEFNLELFSYNPLGNTGLEWYCQPVDELIYQEYNDREDPSNGCTVFGNAVVRIRDACSPDESDDDATQETGRDSAMAWKKLRPSYWRTVCISLYFGFLISVLTAGIIGTVAILVYYVSYQIILICLARRTDSIPIRVQWSKDISNGIVIAPSHVTFFATILFYFRPYQIKGIKRELLVISLIFYVLTFLYQVCLQAFGIYYSGLRDVLMIPGNALFALSTCVQSWVLARHFATTVGTKKLKMFLWLVVSYLLPLVVGVLFANFIYPVYSKENSTGKIYFAVFIPLIALVLKGISRLCVQRLWKISDPGRSFVLLVPLYYGLAVMLRLLQVDLQSWKSVALIETIHGVAEVIERSIVVLIDYLYHQIYERKLLPWENYRSPRRERFAADTAIMSMLYEATAVISVNGFLHFYEYYYAGDKTPLLLLKSFAITTAVPLTIEWFFTSMSIAIETRYQNRPVIAVWRRQWKRHLTAAVINAFPIAVWTSTSLLIAVQGRFVNMKDYCEMPFTHF